MRFFWCSLCITVESCQHDMWDSSHFVTWAQENGHFSFFVIICKCLRQFRPNWEFRRELDAAAPPPEHDCTNSKWLQMTSSAHDSSACILCWTFPLSRLCLARSQGGKKSLYSCRLGWDFWIDTQKNETVCGMAGPNRAFVCAELNLIHQAVSEKSRHLHLD